MIYMYGGPIGRDKISREIKYVKRTIYVKGDDRKYLSITYLKDSLLLACSNYIGSAMEEVSVGRLDYEIVSVKNGISKYVLRSKHPLDEQ